MVADSARWPARAMSGAWPMTVDQVSERTRLRLRCAQEWLNAQAASGFVDYWWTTPARPSWAGVDTDAMVKDAMAKDAMKKDEIKK
jgi:hypothetical protein